MYKFFKRFLDIIISFLAITVLCGTLFLPVLILVNCFATEWKPIFIQKRIGRKNVAFNILKLRTMKASTPSEVESDSIIGIENHFTKFGYFLRKSRLDELPQIFNIFIGQMSFIGPRPILWNNFELHELRNKNNIYSLRPGLTGLAQLDTSHSLSNAEKVEKDTEYRQNISFKLDFSIFFSTLAHLFKVSKKRK